VQDREKGEWVCGKISAGTITAMREKAAGSVSEVDNQ
jgi:hypothetical protein